MEVIDKFKRKEVRYKDVEVGTVFKFEDYFYLTTAQIKCDNGFIYNCVCLNNGELCGLEDCEIVELVEAKLIAE